VEKNHSKRPDIKKAYKHYLNIAFPAAKPQVFSGVLRGAGDTKYITMYFLGVIAIFRPKHTYIFCYPSGLEQYLPQGDSTIRKGLKSEYRWR